MTRTQMLGVAAALLALSSTAFGQNAAFKSTTQGNPGVQSIDAIAFGPQGTLLIGDTKGRQVVAIDTGDTTMIKWDQADVADLSEKLAGRIGTTAKGIDITKMVVNPASRKAYFAVLKKDDKKSLILTMDGTGKINEFGLENVKYVKVPLPVDAKTQIALITDIAWGGDRVMVALQANETFGSKFVSIMAPLEKDAKAAVFNTDTYHVWHKKWETKAPIKTMTIIEEAGKKYLVGAFTCTPIVKYSLNDLQPGAKVKGESVIENGNGNHPRDMFVYEKGGKKYILMSTVRAFGADVNGSKYWTVRVDYDILNAKKINEDALVRNPKDDKGPAVVVTSFTAVSHMDQLDADRALVIRTDAKGMTSLAALPLP